MIRYIDADALIRKHCKTSATSVHTRDGEEHWFSSSVDVDDIKRFPTADVEEVKTAVFEECANNSGYKCSRCKARVKIRDVVNGTHKYCYKCGARFVGVIPYREEKE